MTHEIMRCYSAIVLAACLALPQAAVAAEGAEDAAAGDASVPGLQFLYDFNKRHLLAAADEIPAADYSFRPTPELRSVAEILGHVADVQFLLCSSALGEPNPGGTGDASAESSRAEKDAVVAALRASFDYCDAVYEGLTGDSLARPSRDGGPAAQALTINVYHAGQHYGHLSVSMRLKGMIPPSSRPRSSGDESTSSEDGDSSGGGSSGGGSCGRSGSGD